MANKSIDNIKYGLLRIIDVSGFTIFDPVVRLAFGEEPNKQVSKILKYIVIPTLFVFFCIWFWANIAPTHKTKSGQVPTPSLVLDTVETNYRQYEREQEKEAAFLATGSEKEALLKDTEERLASLKQAFEASDITLKEVETKATAEIDATLAPLNKEISGIAEKLKELNNNAKIEQTALAEAIAQGSEKQETLVKALDQYDKEKESLSEQRSALSKKLTDAREDPDSLKKARLETNSLANEIQHTQSVIDHLNKKNREHLVSELQTKASDAHALAISSKDPKEILKASKDQVRNTSKVSDVQKREYAPTSTVFWHQIKRSIFTVFVGFIIAAVIAIPIGMMCGLNRIAMACFTPIISIFKPVSPVVWLLIFQIVVGAFFPDPETHPLFVLSSNLPFIKDLGVNPAMVFSACTVAMCAVWPALVNTALAVSSIEQDHLNVARVLKLSFFDRLFKIIVPSSLPLVFAGLRISLGVGWMVLIAAEALSSSDGLGKFVWDEYQNGSSFSFANIIMACFIVGIIGFFLDRLMICLQRLVSFDEDSATI